MKEVGWLFHKCQRQRRHVRVLTQYHLRRMFILRITVVCCLATRTSAVAQFSTCVDYLFDEQQNVTAFPEDVSSRDIRLIIPLTKAA